MNTTNPNLPPYPYSFDPNSTLNTANFDPKSIQSLNPNSNLNPIQQVEAHQQLQDQLLQQQQQFLSIQQQQLLQQQQYQQQLQQSTPATYSPFSTTGPSQLRPSGLRPLQQQQQWRSVFAAEPYRPARSGVIRIGTGTQNYPPFPSPGPPPPPLDVLMAQQDAHKVCNPNFKAPFCSVDDAVRSLLPYHVLFDNEAEEDDRSWQWNKDVYAKVEEFVIATQKQLLAFNIFSCKRAEGQLRSEERLMLENVLLNQEKQALQAIKAHIESRQNASRDATEAKMRLAIAQTEHARAMTQAHQEMIIRPSAVASSSHGYQGPGHDVGLGQQNNMEIFRGLENSQRDDEVAPVYFLNLENEPETGETSMKNASQGADPDSNSK